MMGNRTLSVLILVTFIGCDQLPFPSSQTEVKRVLILTETPYALGFQSSQFPPTKEAYVFEVNDAAARNKIWQAARAEIKAGEIDDGIQSALPICHHIVFFFRK